MPLRDDESRRAGGSSMALRAAFPATIPVMTGFLCLGTAYGLLMQSKGYGPGWSVLMSAIAFGGSMQFVAVTLLTTAFDPVQAFLLSVMVNARHMFYGLSLLDKYKGLGKVRPFLIYVLCDETFSLVSTLGHRNRSPWRAFPPRGFGRPPPGAAAPPRPDPGAYRPQMCGRYPPPPSRSGNVTSAITRPSSSA